ncbi:MAG TPA: HEAT repeat domain-containing protein, partial [Phycisphaerae bacterium]|nr:HEAT repeat domain-containing protein [Phycisphaerae bacterium]
MTNRWPKWIALAAIAAVALTWTHKPCLAAPDEARLAAAIKTIQSWKYGEKADAQGTVAAEVVKAGQDPAARKQMEKRMIDALAGAKSRGGKAFFCRQLVLVGSEAAVPALARLLADGESSHMARYALARLPGKAADKALLKALANADDVQKVGMIYSLGRRGCKDAVEAILPLVESKNDNVAVASLVALSRIDSGKAVAAIAKARTTVSPKVRPTATAAYLDCAKRMAAAGKAEAAVAIYRKLFAASEPTMCRIAALNGLVATAGDDRALSTVIAALGDKDAKVRQAAAPALRDVPGPAATRAIAAELSKQDGKVQPMLLIVLADRGDKAALPAVVKVAQGPAGPGRIAALQALGSLGDASTVGLLAERA